MTTGSPSRKLSPSSKWKFTDLAEEIRKRKNSNRTHRRSGSKKYRPRDNYVSISENDDESQSSSSSSSESEDYYKRRHWRSRANRKVKSKKKRSKSPSHTRETSRYGKDVVRKKKKSKRNNVKLKFKKKNSDKRSDLTSSSSGSENYSQERSKVKSKSKSELKERELKTIMGRCRHKRSRSSSPYAAMGVHESKRLKSVITVAVNEENEDEFKEELTYDNEECPCRSCDSNEVFTRKETYNQPSYVDVTHVRNLEKADSLEHNTAKYDGLQWRKHGFYEPIGGNNHQQHEVPSNFKSTELHHDDKTLSLNSGHHDQEVGTTIKSDDLGSIEAHGGTALKISEEKTSSTLPFSENERKMSGIVKNGEEIQIDKLSSTSCTDTGESRNPFPVQTPIGCTEKMTAINGEPGKNSVEDTKNGMGDGRNPGFCNSKDGESSEKVNVAAEKDDESQFEHKTMSVTRGGEMVQVGYKVYIPKRAPTLPRRLLRR